MESMMNAIDKYTDEIIIETFDIKELKELNEFDKAFFKKVALMELLEIVLENYFELFYENKKLRRKLREKTLSKRSL